MVVEIKTIETLNEFGAQEKLADDMANEARKELGLEVEEFEKGEGSKKEPSPEGETEEQKAAKTKESEDAQKAEETEVKKKEEDKKKEEEDRLLTADEKDLKDDEKYRKIKILEARSEDKKKQEDVIVTAFAGERKISVDDARKELEHISKVSEKYGGDTKKLAEAYLHIQRAYTKSQDDLKRVQEAAPIKAIENATDDDIIADLIDAGKITINGKPAAREQLIERYRSVHVKQTENVEDDAVLYQLANDIRQNLITRKSAQMQDIKVKAKEKRIELVSSISESDKEFVEGIKAVIENSPDEQILSESFSVQDIVRWAKGEKYDNITKTHSDDVKKAYDDGYKKGKEEAKILGIKQETIPKAPARTSNATLSEAAKKEALDMYQSVNASDDEKYKMYLETVPDKRRPK